MDETERQLFSVRALIFCDDRFLIIGRIHPKNGKIYWELPNVKVKYEGSLEYGLEEDIFKEIGLVIRCLKPISTWQLTVGETQVKGFTFLCKAKHSYVALSPAHADCAWITPEQSTVYNIYPGVRKEMSRWDWDKLIEDVKSSSPKFRSPRHSGRKTSKRNVYGRLMLSKKDDKDK